jgi:hypothetical protein
VWASRTVPGPTKDDDETAAEGISLCGEVKFADDTGPAHVVARPAGAHYDPGVGQALQFLPAAEDGSPVDNLASLARVVVNEAKQSPRYPGRDEGADRFSGLPSESPGSDKNKISAIAEHGSP